MNNQEFNPVYDNEAASRLEFSPAEDEKPRREEGAQKKEFFADDRDAEKEFSGGSTENAESDDNKKDTASRRKRLKMLLALTGTTVVVASSGVFRSSTPTPPAGEGHTDACIFTTEYNDLFEEILELKDKEQYMDILTLVNTSEELYDCVETLYPGLDKYLADKLYDENITFSSSPIYYDGRSASNCRYNLLSPITSNSSPYIYLQLSINGLGEIHVINVCFADSLNFSENYFQTYDTFTFTDLEGATLNVDSIDETFNGYHIMTSTYTGITTAKDFYEHWEFYYDDGSFYESEDFYAEFWDQGPSGDMYGQNSFPKGSGITSYSEEALIGHFNRWIPVLTERLIYFTPAYDYNIHGTNFFTMQ